MKQFAIFDSSGNITQIVYGDKSNIPKNIQSDLVEEIFTKLPDIPSSSGNWKFSKNSWSWENQETPEEALANHWLLVRTERDRLLQASDWTQLPDVPLATKEAWAAYRQALRDVTDQPDPFNIIWPTPPN